FPRVPVSLPLGAGLDRDVGQPLGAALRGRRLHRAPRDAPGHDRRTAGALTMNTEARFLSEPGPMGLFTRLTRVGLLLDGFQHRALDPFGLRFIDFSVLRVLQLAAAPYRASAGELSEIVLRSTGGMTQILDRLEQLGFVQRVPDPSDRRKVLA